MMCRHLIFNRIFLFHCVLGSLFDFCCERYNIFRHKNFVSYISESQIKLYRKIQSPSVEPFVILEKKSSMFAPKTLSHKSSPTR